MMQVSSAKWFDVDLSRKNCKSLMYKRNKNGPNVDPWGTPHFTSKISDLKPWIDTNCLRLDKNDINNLSDVSLKP